MHARLKKIRSHRRWHRRLGIVRFARDDRGVQLAELAIVLPVLVLMFAATAEFGRYFYEYSTLAKASRVGTRYLATACVGPSFGTDTKAKNLVVYGNVAGTGSPIISGLSTSNIRVTYLNSLGNPQTQGVPEIVKVDVTGYTFQPLFNLGGLMNNNGLSLNIAVKPSVTMRYLVSAPCV